MNAPESSPWSDASREYIDMTARDAAYARTMSRVAIGALLVLSLSLVGNIYQASLPRAVPYVLQEAKDGALTSAQLLAPAQRPDLRWIQHQLADWITCTRTITSDPSVQNEFQARTAAMLAAGSSAESQVISYYATVHTGDNMRVSAKVNFVRPAASDRRYEIDWVEQTIDHDGKTIATDHWNGIATINYAQNRITIPGANDTTVLANPYGMYITDLTWNKVAY
jgi:type IV secretory pathway TrbF-like protein